MSAPTFVVGTAGHVDHGKSSLVRALTGTDPDRLAEEQLRQMTIDLGFAELVTPGGNRVHLVDVPGHERFVRNMLAGAGGIDAAIVVIAADDGPMPQTREHLAILDLLGIERGVVAVTKADLVDGEWLGFVTESIGELLRTTGLADIEIVPVSSVTGSGLDELQHALDRALLGFERSFDSQPARLPIDRVFSMSGFGTIVTGTLIGASLRIGERVEISPGGRPARIRGLQTFGASVAEAVPGSRVAVNLAGLETTDLNRGDVLGLPGVLRPAMRLDAHVRLLASSERALEHNDEVIVFAGSSETPARAAMLTGDALIPDSEGWVQLRCARPIVVLPGDRFVLRRPSPPETIGGGRVVELDPPRHKRDQPQVVARLAELAAGDPGERLLAWIGERFVDARQLAGFSLGADDSRQIAEMLLAEGRLLRVGPFVAASRRVVDVQNSLRDAVDAFHLSHPLDAGMPREQLRESSGLERPIFEALLPTSADLVLDGPLVRRVDFQIVLDADQQAHADAYLAKLLSARFQPPTLQDFDIEADLVRAMSHLGSIVEIGDGIAFTPERLAEARSVLLSALGELDSISLAEYRDRLGTTRRYAQALLEYFDRQRVTRRIGDRRVAARPLEFQEDAATR
jgi:selenocysteine-specific elongation factor